MAENKGTFLPILIALIGAAATIAVSVINKPSLPDVQPAKVDVSSISTANSESSSSARTVDPMSTAMQYYAAKKYTQAIPLFRESAELGNAEAENFMGAIYESGQWGLPKTMRRP